MFFNQPRSDLLETYYIDELNFVTYFFIKLRSELVVEVTCVNLPQRSASCAKIQRIAMAPENLLKSALRAAGQITRLLLVLEGDTGERHHKTTGQIVWRED